MQSLKRWHTITTLYFGVIIRVKAGHSSNLFLRVALLFADTRKILGNIMRKIVSLHYSMVSKTVASFILEEVINHAWGSNFLSESCEVEDIRSSDLL